MDFRHIQVVWLGLLGGLATYTGVVYALQAGGSVGIGAIPPEAIPYMGACAVMLMLAGLVVKRRMVAAIPRDSDPERRLELYFTAVVVGLAIVEGAGILLITLSLLSGAESWTLVGGGAGVALLVVGRPSREEAGLGRGR